MDPAAPKSVAVSKQTLINVAPKPTDELTAQQLIDLFNSGAVTYDGVIPDHMVGRFGRGTASDPQSLAMLSDESHKKLSFVFGADTIKGFLGKSPTQAMLSVGSSKSWLRNRLTDGTQHRLVMFPCPDSELKLATWDNILELIGQYYDKRIYDKLIPFLHELKTTHIKDIDSKGRLRYISELPVKDKHKHDEFYSPEKILKKKNINLFDVRGFMYHTIGCNYLFIGKGYSRSPNGDDLAEYLIPNRKITSIPSLASTTVSVSESEIINEHEGQILSKKERCLRLAELIRDKEPIPADSLLPEGIVGRFVRGTREEDFEKLSDEEANLVSFVFGSDTIRAFCGMTASKAMISLGFTKQMLVSLNQQNFKHKLVLFPEPALCRRAKWNLMMDLVRECYGEDVYEKVNPHLRGLMLTDYKVIDPEGRLAKIMALSREEKAMNPEYYSPDRIRELETVSLYDARGFFYHSVRCNALFEGIGYTRSRNGDDDRAEYLVKNMRIADVQDAVVIDVEFYERELE
ncbi:hypothetical protein HDU98_011103 [Podochytrium sp. JEL0797]|nr:hypothetical protein HDU98_011103 [Podochytrium sp. JEL0797]